MSVLKWVENACDWVMDQSTYSTGHLVGQPAKPAPLLIAHRGAWERRPRSERFENSLAAFTYAQKLGLPALELDIHFTSDHVPVVNHDANLRRIHGVAGNIADRTLSQIRAESPALPTLAEVLALKGLHFMIEVKTPLTVRQVEVLQQQLKSLNPGQEFHFLTLNSKLIFKADLFPPSTWVLVGDIQLAHLVQTSIEMNLGGVAGHYLAMSKRLIDKLHAHGQVAGVGFVPTPNLFNREWSRGIDWVFTNHAQNFKRASFI